MAYLHGAYTEEQATAITPPVQVDSAVQIVVGTTPVNLGNANDPMSPQTHYSHAGAAKKIGYSADFESFTISEVLKTSFEIYNVAPVITINVLDPKQHVTAIIADEIKLVKGVAVLEQSGVLLDGVLVRSKDVSTTYEDQKDYALSFNKSGYLVIDASIKDSAITAETQELTISYKILDPEKVTKQDILDGIQKIKQVYPIFNIMPGLLLCPGWSHDPEVYMAMTANCEKLNGKFRCMAIADLDISKATDVDKVNAVKNQCGMTNQHSIVLWPMCCIGETLYHMSSLAGAHIAYTDYQNSGVPYVSPSNKPFRISGICDADMNPIILDEEIANDMLNAVGVCTAINQNGWRFWGNNTAAYPATTDPKDRWISVRRMFSWWGNTFILTYRQKVDDNTDLRLIESVVDSENIRANGFKARNQIAEAKIEFNIDENPQTELLNGHLRFHQKLAFYTPAEAIINVLEFDADALVKSLT